MDVRFTVGEMAKLNGLTKQMLIYYDKENVFKPKIVDSVNGYRYYTAEQLEELDSILLLREMGFSLKEIKSHMQNRDGFATLEMLREQKRAVGEKLARLRLIEKRLERKIENLEDFYASADLEFFIECQPEYLALEKVDKPCGLLEVDIALKKLLQKASEWNYPHFYQLGDMVSAENLNKGNYLSFDYAFLPLVGRFTGSEQHIKTGGTYARRYHIGSYESMDKTYKAMLQEIKEKGYHPTGYSYEYCVLDCLTTKTPDEYITEIQIKVEKD